MMLHVDLEAIAAAAAAISSPGPIAAAGFSLWLCASRKRRRALVAVLAIAALTFLVVTVGFRADMDVALMSGHLEAAGAYAMVLVTVLIFPLARDWRLLIIAGGAAGLAVGPTVLKFGCDCPFLCLLLTDEFILIYYPLVYSICLGFVTAVWFRDARAAGALRCSDDGQCGAALAPEQLPPDPRSAR